MLEILSYSFAIAPVWDTLSEAVSVDVLKLMVAYLSSPPLGSAVTVTVMESVMGSPFSISTESHSAEPSDVTFSTLHSLLAKSLIGISPPFLSYEMDWGFIPISAGENSGSLKHPVTERSATSNDAQKKNFLLISIFFIT